MGANTLITWTLNKWHLNETGAKQLQTHRLSLLPIPIFVPVLTQNIPLTTEIYMYSVYTMQMQMVCFFPMCM